MKTNHSTDQDDGDTAEVAFAANNVRLSVREWAVVAVAIGCAFWLTPFVWRIVEPLEIGPDYRVPYSLGYDYWHFERTCRDVCGSQKTILFGDSVIWGEYVDSDATLSHCFNELAGSDRFANLSIDGIHPVAMAGLLEHYGEAICGKNVVVNCNPLWMSSARRDLSEEKEATIHHPALVPQFQTSIPCYKASISERLGIVVGHHLGFLSWADHLRIAYFGSEDLPHWTIEHPYNNPAKQVTLVLPHPNDRPEPLPDRRPWTEKGIRQLTPDWVPLAESLQWQFFRRTIRLLQERGNQVFVIVGPLNEHMLTEEGRSGYVEQTDQMAAWLTENGISHCVASLLPTELYADLSHPTAEGYELLAEQLFDRIGM